MTKIVLMFVRRSLITVSTTKFYRSSHERPGESPPSHLQACTMPSPTSTERKGSGGHVVQNPHRNVEHSAGAAQSPSSARGECATPVRTPRSKWFSRALPYVVFSVWLFGFVFFKRAMAERRRVKALGASAVHHSHLTGAPAPVAYGLHGVRERARRVKLAAAADPDGHFGAPSLSFDAKAGADAEADAAAKQGGEEEEAGDEAVGSFVNNSQEDGFVQVTLTNTWRSTFTG
ncbi:hypothetical protein T484DRAFT_3015683 [Baffinella frigidus]|nr:hypothetical protein T484DRAFT_3015683 [Cryptophyta sp. CCMP2293]